MMISLSSGKAFIISDSTSSLRIPYMDIAINTILNIRINRVRLQTNKLILPSRLWKMCVAGCWLADVCLHDLLEPKSKNVTVINTVEMKNEIIIPADVKLPVILTGDTSLVINDRNPMAVVKQVKKHGTPITFIVSVMDL